MSAPDRIWLDPEGFRDGWTSLPEQIVHGDVEYTRSDLIPAMIREAVAAEREACAAMIERRAGSIPYRQEIAAEIRAGQAAELAAKWEAL